MEFRRKRRSSVEIGLIPMIDVLLVLLFFFMIATTFRHHTELKINLPEAAGSEANQDNQALNLFIDANGAYSLTASDGKALPVSNANLDGLKAALAQQTPASRQLPLIINADGKAQHQAVVSALDVANQLGFHHLSFAINPPEHR